MSQNTSQNYDLVGSAIKAERFFKQNKLIIILIIVLICGFFGYQKISDYLQNEHSKEATALYFKALENHASKQDLERLKSLNENLFAAYFLNSEKPLPEGLKIDALLADFAAIKQGQNSIFLQDLKTLEKAFSAQKSGDNAGALALAKSVPANSAFYAMAQALIHYGALK